MIMKPPDYLALTDFQQPFITIVTTVCKKVELPMFLDKKVVFCVKSGYYLI